MTEDVIMHPPSLQKTVLGEAADELRDTVRAYVEHKSPEVEVRRLMETDQGFAEATWVQMGRELELQGIAIPERFGGAGFTIAELAVVFEEMGRVLFCAPFLSTVALAATALLASGDEEACAEYLPRIATGELRAALVTDWPEWEAIGDGDMIAKHIGADYALSGSRDFVIDGHTAQLLLVVADAPAGPTLFAVEGDSPEVRRSPTPTLDPTRKQAYVEFAGARARRVGDEGAANVVRRSACEVACVALAAEQAGGAAACVAMATDYAKVRVQFGRPIGSFQAVKHKCVEMFRHAELARVASHEAARRVGEGHPDAQRVVSIAKTFCSETYSWIANENIHLHGGIGYTWEHPAHLYYRRAKSSEQMFGTPSQHRCIVLEQTQLRARVCR